MSTNEEKKIESGTDIATKLGEELDAAHRKLDGLGVPRSLSLTDKIQWLAELISEARAKAALTELQRRAAIADAKGEIERLGGGS